MGASSSSSSTKTTQKSAQQQALTGVGNLIKLLPTGTVFLFQFLNPVVTNNGGKCNTVNKYLDAILIGLCGLSCCFASFTDSYTDSDGNTHYGIVTKNGLWPTSSSSSSTDLSSHKLRFGDFVHAFFAVIVFAGLSLLDTNTVRCFYPEFEDTKTVLLQVLPPVIGVVSGSVFMLFPNTRHGIGYPQSVSTSQNTN